MNLGVREESKQKAGRKCASLVGSAVAARSEETWGERKIVPAS